MEKTAYTLIYATASENMFSYIFSFDLVLFYISTCNRIIKFTLIYATFYNIIINQIKYSHFIEVNAYIYSCSWLVVYTCVKV